MARLRASRPHSDKLKMQCAMDQKLHNVVVCLTYLNTEIKFNSLYPPRITKSLQQMTHTRIQTKNGKNNTHSCTKHVLALLIFDPSCIFWASFINSPLHISRFFKFRKSTLIHNDRRIGQLIFVSDLHTDDILPTMHKCPAAQLRHNVKPDISYAVTSSSMHQQAQQQ